MHEHSILIVEDNQTLRRLLEYRISKHYNVRAATDGEHAIQLVEEGMPDLIISDIMMPRMDGFALLRALRRSEQTAAIPFIFLTAKTDDPSREKGLRDGVDDYITKPFDIDYVLKRVEQILNRSKVYQNKLNARIGRDFSDRLLPKTMPQVENYDAQFFSQPKEDGGGDLFDWAQAGDGSYLFTVGDIMGKGLQAKFYAFSFLSYIRSTVHSMLGTTSSPAALMSGVNRMLIQDKVLEETFASLLLMRWEPHINRITYANAGHCRPILVSPAGAGIVEYSDLILGLDPNSEYVDKAFTIPPNSALLSYTDGLNEQVSSSGEQFGEVGVAVCATEAIKAERPIEALLQSMLTKSEEKRFADDILAFWLQRGAN